MTDLLVDWCSYAAAKYAVEKWHYSGRLISTYTRPVYLGVWEGGQFIGCVVFSHGTNKNIGSPYGLTQFQVCELVRVALKQHTSFVSQVVSIAVKKVKQHSPGLRLIVSYADTEHGHIGTIYQAGNWLYVGESRGGARYKVNGRIMHQRAVDCSIGNRSGLHRIDGTPKHKYLYPLDRAMRRQIAPLAQPYPKRDTRPANGSNQATSPVRRFDSDPAALPHDQHNTS